MSNPLRSHGVSHGRRLIESDAFPIELVSELAEMESWRKEVHRPTYHIHKWWANRLGFGIASAGMGAGQGKWGAGFGSNGEAE